MTNIDAISRRHSISALLALTALATDARRLRAEDEVGSKEESAARLALMHKIAGSITLAESVQGGTEHAVAIRPEPLLRYNDPPRNMHDASLWAWGNRGRPAAVLKVEFYPPHPPARRWVLGLVALSPRLVAVDFHDGQRWVSSKPGLDLRALAGAPPPAKTDKLRLIQMKALARRFAASEYAPEWRRGRIQHHLMPTPLDRFADSCSGLTDGAIFGFARRDQSQRPSSPSRRRQRQRPAGTPPQPGNTASARGSEAASSTIHLDGESVWSVATANPPVQLETYMNRRIAEGNEPR